MLGNDDHLESALARMAVARQEADELRRRTVERTFSASPKNKLFTLVVGGRGELKSLTFRGDDYRALPPAELAEILVRTFERARKNSVAAAMEGIGALSSGVPMPMEMLSGATSTDDFISTLIDATSRALPGEDSTLPVRKD